MTQAEHSYLSEPGCVPPGRTFGSYVRASVARFPEQVALEDAGDRINYEELWRRSRALATGLSRLGVQAGDRVAVIEPNSQAYVYAFLASALLGAIVVHIPPDYGQRELDYIFQESQPRAIITVKEWRGFDFPAAIARAFGAGDMPAVVVSDEPAGHGLDELLSLPALPDAGMLPEWEADASLLLQFTSGTTGTPKGCLHSHNSLCRPAAAMDSVLPVTSADRILVVASMAHLLGLVDGVFLALMNGACIIPVARWRPDEAVDLLAQTRPTILSAVPPMYFQLRKVSPQADLPGLRDVRACITAGTALPDPTVAWLRDVLGAAIVNQYGLTEISNCSDTRPSEQGLVRDASVGRPTPSSECKVVDEGGRIVPQGEPGEVYLRTPWRFLGYYRQPEKTAELVDSAGWVRTGDFGYVDSDRQLHIVSRKKDLIIRGGENISPDELESILNELEYVEAVAVVGVPEERLGERTVAYVVPRVADETVTRSRVAADLRDRVARYKIPDEVVTVADLPRTASGKVQRVVLRERAVRDSAGKPGEAR
ncbi:MAG: acyl--CoA ligase [Thermoleophilia bacterium]|nr:acyl--CoA ligase [Thermoleophilia bacterium]